MWAMLQPVLQPNLQVFGLNLSQQPGPLYQLVGFSLGVCGDFSSLYLPQSNFSSTWELPITCNLREPDSLNLFDKNYSTVLPELKDMKGLPKVPSFQATIRFYYGPFSMVMNLHSPFPHFLNKKAHLSEAFHNDKICPQII